jgi:hypothetical protein
LLITVLLAGMFCVLEGCPDDPPPQPASINGNYLGTYHFTEIRGDTDTVRELAQPVYVVFRKPEFSIQLAPGVAESLRVMCDMSGRYELGKGVLLKCSAVDSADSCGEPLVYPCGFFALEQTTDTMWLTRDTTFADAIRYIRKLALLPAVRR